MTAEPSPGPPDASTKPPTRRWGRRSSLLEVQEEVDDLLALADVSDEIRVYLRARWAAQVERAARSMGNNKRNYYFARIPAVVGAVVLPALTTPTVDVEWIRWSAWVTSIIVAVATGVESVFRFGARWRIYRLLLDSLRAEAWAFQFALTPDYASVEPSERAPMFLTRCEDILARHRDSYVADVLVPSERSPSAEDQAAHGAGNQGSRSLHTRRRGWDSNPRTVSRCALSRRVPSATRRPRRADPAPPDRTAPEHRRGVWRNGDAARNVGHLMTSRRIMSRLAAPVVWLLAAGWVALTAVGRGIGHGHDWYEAAWSAIGRGSVRAGRAVLGWLGPLGRALLRLARPIVRALRWIWDQVGLRLWLFLTRPLGRLGRWLVARTGPIADRIVQWARRVALRAAPVTRALASGIGAVERAGARFRAMLGRAFAPAGRAVRAVAAGWSTRRR